MTHTITSGLGQQRGLSRRHFLQRSARTGVWLSCAPTASILAMDQAGAQTTAPTATQTAEIAPSSVLVRDGDVLFRASTPDTVSRLIAQFSPLSPAQWTHVGIVRVLPSAPEVPLVIHAMPERGVIVEPLDAFVSPEQAIDFALLRPSQAQWASDIAAQAQRYVGRPFDNEMRTSDEDRIYCTELVAKVWSAVAKHHAHGRGRPRLVRLSTVRVPLYAEPIVHPDGMFRDLLSKGDFILVGVGHAGRSTQRPTL